MNDITQGAQTLKAWLDSSETSRADFAVSCGVSRQMIYKWQGGSHRPSAAQRHRVEHLTGGTVVVADWLTTGERVEVTR